METDIAGNNECKISGFYLAKIIYLAKIFIKLIWPKINLRYFLLKNEHKYPKDSPCHYFIKFEIDQKC